MMGLGLKAEWEGGKRGWEIGRVKGSIARLPGKAKEQS